MYKKLKHEGRAHEKLKASSMKNDTKELLQEQKNIPANIFIGYQAKLPVVPILEKQNSWLQQWATQKRLASLLIQP